MTRRLVTFLLCAALVVAACSNDDDPSVDAAGSTTAPPAAPATPGDTTAPAPGGGDGQSQQTTPPPTAVGSGEPVPAEPESPQQESAAGGSAGSYAPQLLGGSSGQLLVEVIAEPGVEARRGTLDHVAATLQQVSGKAVTAAVATTPAPSDGSWTADELRAVADASGSPQADGRAVIHLVFVHGRWHESDTVLGVAVRGDTAAVFVDAIADAASPLVGAGAVEEAATLHEVGHLLGLVDLYLRTGREDPEHPGHSANDDSVMYWAVESTLITDVLAGGPPRTFDGDDLADLATIKNQG